MNLCRITSSADGGGERTSDRAAPTAQEVNNVPLTRIHTAGATRKPRKDGQPCHTTDGGGLSGASEAIECRTPDVIDSATDTTKEVAPANAIPYPIGISWRGRGTVSGLPEAVGMSSIEALRPRQTTSQRNPG